MEARSPPGERRRILVVDDHALMREALERLIEQQADLEVGGSAEGREATRRCLASSSPDLAIVDLSLQDCEGIDLVKELHDELPSLPILVLSMHDERLYAENVYRAGARGYLMKEVASEQLIPAVRRLLAGELVFSESMTEKLSSGDSASAGEG